MGTFLYRRINLHIMIDRKSTLKWFMLYIEVKKYPLKNEKLNLSALDIDHIPEIDGLKDISKLKVLDLSFNKITEINGLDSLKELQVLYLNRNLISEIKGLDALSSLQELYLHSNRIRKLNGLNALINLHTLTLGHNPLPSKLIEKLGGLYNHVYVNTPLKFVKYCKNMKYEKELVQKILKFECENQKEMEEVEVIRDLKLNIDTAEKTLESLNSVIDYDKSELNLIKQKATDVIRKFDRPTLFDLINTLEFNLNIAKKVGKYMIDKGWIDVFPRVPKKEILVSETRICPYCYSKVEEDKQICSEYGSILKSDKEKVS